MMKLIRVSAILGLFASTSVEAQSLLAPTQHVNLRKGTTTKSAKIAVLAPSDTVTMLTPDSLRRGYYHVATAQADTGWVSRTYMKHVAGGGGVGGGGHAAVVTNVATAGLDNPAGAFSPDWPKADPNHADMTNAANSAQVCHFGGTPGASEHTVNTLKNRSDTPAQYHAVTWDALAHLPWPQEATTHRDPDAQDNGGWTAAENAAIAPYEREAIMATGFIAKIRQQAKNHESTNCGWGGEDNTDWHIEFVGSFVNGKAQSETEAVVVETTPRVKRVHPNWHRLTDFEDPKQSTDSVRISGWLMLDPEHKAHLGHYRQTLWEIHPITRIEVFTGGKWVNLDVLP
jgi:hypothetical protein